MKGYSSLYKLTHIPCTPRIYTFEAITQRSDGFILATRGTLNAEFYVCDMHGDESFVKIDTDSIVDEVYVTPDGRKIALVGRDCDISIWTLSNGQSPRADNIKSKKIIGKNDGRLDLVMSKDSKRLLYINSDGWLVVLNLDTLETVQTFEGRKFCARMAISCNNEKIATYNTVYDLDPHVVKIYDTSTKENVANHDFGEEVKQIAPTGNANEFAIVLRKNEIHLWNTKTGNREIIHTLYDFIDSTSCVALNSDNTMIAYLLDIETLVLQDRHGNYIWIDFDGRGVVKISFTQDDTKLMVCGMKDFKLYDAAICPFWKMKNHHTFEEKKTIGFLYTLHQMRSKLGKRKRSAIMQIPRDVLLYIFSFIKRSR